MEKRGMQFVRYADGHVMVRKMAGDQIAAQSDLSAEEWDEVVAEMTSLKATFDEAAAKAAAEAETPPA